MSRSAVVSREDSILSQRIITNPLIDEAHPRWLRSSRLFGHVAFRPLKRSSRETEISGNLLQIPFGPGELSENECEQFAAPLPVFRVAGDLGPGVCFRVWGGIRLEAGETQMLYKKINVELIVVADEAEAVVTDLNAALDRLEEKHTLFGGGIETVPVRHRGTRKRSALAHTVAAGETVAGAVRTARDKVTVALRAVI
jgi:hypothetical protein